MGKRKVSKVVTTPEVSVDAEGNLVGDTSYMSKRKVNKRRKKVALNTAEDIEASVNLNLEEGWLTKVLELPGNEIAKLLGDIANHAKVTTAAFKKARTSLPSFSGVKWTDFAENFGLPYKLQENPFQRVVTPIYSLPPSVHEIMFEAAWRTQDVYQERQKQRIEAARVRIMDPYLVRIIGIFQGRVIDKPEQAMLETEYTTGGEVEHEIFMIGGILFFIAQFKLDMSLEDNVAQLFAQLLGPLPKKTRKGTLQIYIYGLLTDLIDFRFYSYDPLAKQFAFDSTMIVNITRDISFTDTIPVANKIFSVILTAFIDGLETTLSKSIESKNKGDVSSPGSAPLQQMQRSLPKPGPAQLYTRNSGQKSTNCWEAALQLARQCRDKFNEPVETIDDIEMNSTAALELLAMSVRSISRVSHLSGADDPASTEEIKDLARRMVHDKYLEMMLNGVSYYSF